ncbi:MAG: hypothetical protein KatS3mg122_1488 [Caldimonas sp.]|nr:MAG: hypothetical protein KatS3mg122_1488 [Caldimonas sp.]
MTAQRREMFINEGVQSSLRTQPLEKYFSLTGQRPKFCIPSTSLWRGYVGSWEVRDRRLYLVGIEGRADGGPVTLESLFPGYPERVFAHWYSGVLEAPEGEVLGFARHRYELIQERERFLRVDRGVVVEEWVVHHQPEDVYE